MKTVIVDALNQLSAECSDPDIYIAEIEEWISLLQAAVENARFEQENPTP